MNKFFVLFLCVGVGMLVANEFMVNAIKSSSLPSNVTEIVTLYLSDYHLAVAFPEIRLWFSVRYVLAVFMVFVLQPMGLIAIAHYVMFREWTLR